MSLVTITPKTTKVTSAAGTSVDYVFGVYNGAARTIRVSVETLGELKDKGWLEGLGEAELDLPEKGQQDVIVKVSVPTDATPGKHTFQLRVYDVADPEDAVKSDVVEVEVPAAVVPGPGPTPTPGKKPNWGLIIGLIAGGVVLLAGIIVAIIMLTGGKDTVPDVVNLPLDQAIAALTKAGLETGDVSETVTGNEEPGVVLSQEPEAGLEIPDDKTVALRVEAISIPVPSVKGRSLADAVEAIAAAGLSKGQVGQKRAGNTPGGTVLDQNPAAGARVLPGTPVSLTVAEAAILVRDLTGEPLARAQEWVRQANLTVGRVSEKNEAGEAGIVLSHNPSGGKEAEPGQRVDFLVRAKTVIVPNVSQAAYSTAKEQLEQLGLQVRASYQRTGRNRAGTVFGQSPNPNTRVSIGSTVSLTVEQNVFVISNVQLIDAVQINSIALGRLKTRSADGGLRVVPPDDETE